MKKFIFLIILILLPFKISFGESVPVDTTMFWVETAVSDSVVLQAKHAELGDLISFSVVRAYDTSAVQTGYMFLVFRKEAFHYDVNSSGQVDIRDLVDLVEYMFGDRK